MAMNTVDAAYTDGRLAELEKENESLKEQLRRLSVQAQVSRNAIHEAVGEKETAARLAHQVTVEERATRAAVEVQGTNVGMAVILQIVNFFALLVLLVVTFAWLPQEIQRRVTPVSTTSVITPAPAGTPGVYVQPGIR